MRLIALIPARGGSKRLPRKNVRLFAGRPLIYYSIALARSMSAIERCVVSTDDPEIAALASSFGAEVIERPADLATDTATTASVAVHALETLAHAGDLPDAMLLLQPNCPLRTRAMVHDAIHALADSVCDSVVSVTEDGRKRGLVVDGLFMPHYAPGTRSQDLPRQYFENGLLYAVWTGVVLSRRSVFGSRVRPLVTDPLYAMSDIDTELDFTLAEFLFERYQSHFVDWLDAPRGDSLPRHLELT